MERRSGETTKQMEEAPKDAVFIWVNEHLSYPRDLARKLGRDDLFIKSPSWLEKNYYGLSLTGVVLDHAVYLNERQWGAINMPLLGHA